MLISPVDINFSLVRRFFRVGLSLNKAKKLLIQVGLRLGNLEYEHQPELLENTVIDQNFTAGMRVSFPAAIDLIISTDKEYQ